MSTKTLRKRIALVAVSALGFGLLSVVPSSAAGTGLAARTTGAAITASVSPVRMTYVTGTTPDAVPYAKISWTSPHSTATTDTIVVTLTSAPTSTAILEVKAASEIGTTTGATFTAAGSDGSAKLGTLSGATVVGVLGTYSTTADLTTAFAVAANTPGFYAGTIKYTAVGHGGEDTISFSFTTRGAVASVSAALADAAPAPSGSSSFTVTLKDAAGNTTQPLVVDSVAVTASAGGTPGTPSMSAVGGDVAGSLYDGVAVSTYIAPATASTAATLTATPGGTLGSLAAATASLTTLSTLITSDTVATWTVAAPADRTTLAGTATNATTSIRGGTTSVTFGFTGTAASTYRFKITAGTAASATVNGTLITDADGAGNGASVFVTATTSSSTADPAATGSASFTLGGGAIISGAIITVAAVTATGAASTGASSLVLTSASAAANAAKFTSSPTGALVRTIGTTTSVDVTFKDQFGTALGSGLTGRVYRTSQTAANLLGTATTNASGVATLSVTSVSSIVTGTAETYLFSVEGGGAGETAQGTATLTITYTTAGTITSQSTAMNNSAVTAIVNNEATAWAAQTKYPVITVPGSDGLADSVTGLSGIYTVSTGLVTGTTGAELLALTTTNTPGNTTTWTSDAGAYLSATATPTAAAVLQTLTVANATSVYAYAHTVGLHTFTATSGGKTTTVKVWVVNAPADYYTVSASALSTSIVTGGNTVVTMTLKDMYGNVVDAADALVTATASGSVRLAGQALSQSLNTTAAGTISFTVVGDAAAGTGTVTLAPTGTGAAAWASDFTAVTGASAPVQTVTLTFTVTGATVKTVDQVSTELAAVSATLAAKIAADTAAAATAATAAATAATAAAADKKALDAAIAAVLDAANNATDAATEAIDNGSAATAAAQDAIDAGDAATAAAQDATDAATAAGEAAAAAGEIAQQAADTASEAVDAANAATDAANAAAEAADAATNAALDAVDAANAASDAVAALATQMATAISGLKAQITALTNLIVKIQKKLKA